LRDLRNLSFSLAPRCLRLSFLFFSSRGDHRDLHSFPTRRSSDLHVEAPDEQRQPDERQHDPAEAYPDVRHRLPDDDPLKYHDDRSEEHTSELQSRENLVCRLLLEKKNKKKNQARQTPQTYHDTHT